MSAIGFDSCFYARLDEFSRSLNRVLLSGETPAFAADDDWRQVLSLVETLAAHQTSSLAASSVAASLTGRMGEKGFWPDVAQALAAKKLDPTTMKELKELAWSLDEERTAVLARMRNA
jgi:hypothetical protein